MKKLYLMFLLGLVTCLLSCTNIKEDKKNHSLTDYVNPFIGTGGHGHTYPGATVPFGMLQVSPDNGISKWDWCSGLSLYRFYNNWVQSFTFKWNRYWRFK